MLECEWLHRQISAVHREQINRESGDVFWLAQFCVVGHFVTEDAKPRARDPPETGGDLLGSPITLRARRGIGPCPQQRAGRPSVPLPMGTSRPSF
jgi:hypothetical protein